MATNPQAQELIAKSEVALAQALHDQALALVTDLRKDLPPDEPPPEGAGDDAPPMGDAPPGGEAPPMDGPPPEAGGDAPITMEEAVQMLQSMPPDQLQMWADAVAQVQGGAGGGEPDGDEGPPPSDEPPAEDAMKSELAKMERRITASFQKQIQALAKSAPAPKPARRAATGPERPAAAPQPPRLSKAEVVQKLNVLARDPKLSKSDRAKMNEYVCGPENMSTAGIAHLLKDK